MLDTNYWDGMEKFKKPLYYLGLDGQYENWLKQKYVDFLFNNDKDIFCYYNLILDKPKNDEVIKLLKDLHKNIRINF
jgi:hypothetical protein